MSIVKPFLSTKKKTVMVGQVNPHLKRQYERGREVISVYLPQASLPRFRRFMTGEEQSSDINVYFSGNPYSYSLLQKVPTIPDWYLVEVTAKFQFGLRTNPPVDHLHLGELDVNLDDLTPVSHWAFADFRMVLHEQPSRYGRELLNAPDTIRAYHPGSFYFPPELLASPNFQMFHSLRSHQARRLGVHGLYQLHFYLWSNDL